MVAAAAVVGAACAPAKPSGPVPGRSIAYYYIEDFSLPADADAYRSLTPFTKPVDSGAGTAAQVLNPDGSVSLAVNNALCCEAGAGFYTHLFPLRDLLNVRLIVAPGSSSTFVGLALDANGDGQWADWDANGMRTGFGGDQQGFGPSTGGGIVDIDDSRLFGVDPLGVDATLGELKAGDVVGINGDTLVGLIVIVVPEPFSFGDAHSVATSLTLNGVELLT